MALLERLLLSGSLIASLGFSQAAGHSAAAPARTEYEVKAAFLCNFARFCTWPDDAFPDASTPFTIGVLGPDVFEGRLHQMVEGKRVNNRRVLVKQSPRAGDLRGCHIVFVSRFARSPRLAEALGTSGTLTVGDEPGFAARGGVIGFLLERDRVNFEVNLQSAEAARLEVSSKLLRIAKRILRVRHQR